MTALANENDATPAQGDVDDALAHPMVGEAAVSGLEVTPEAEDQFCRESAEAKEARLTEARKAAMESGDWDAFNAVQASLDNDDSDVPYAQRGLSLRYGQPREPWLLHGLKPFRCWLSPDDAAIYEHRLEVSDALYETGWPGADGRLFFDGFTDRDREDFTSWRPFEINPTVDYSALARHLSSITDVKGAEAALKEVESRLEEGVTGIVDRRKEERFNAVLETLAGQHDEHWFFAHPFCRDCFPLNYPAVDSFYAAWLLKQRAEIVFPTYEWDGQVPPMPVIEEAVDFMSIDDLAALPEPAWLIDNVLPDSGTGVLRARDQSFKSFMALDMAMQVTFNKYGKVLYCVGEGANNFGHRIEAWLTHNDEEFDEEIPGPTFLSVVPNLFTGGDVYDRVLARARQERYDLIIIDTYARATAGSDLNSQGDQAVVTARIDELRRATGGTVLLVAHSQKADTDASGSIEIEDARDFVFSMKRNGSDVTFEVTKQKDGAESARPARYIAQPVGNSMVLVEAGEARDKPLMGAKEWIIAALDNTRGLGPQTEAEIRQWINSHPDYQRFGNKQLIKATSSSTLSRLVEAGTVAKSGTRYSLAEPSNEEAP